MVMTQSGEVVLCNRDLPNIFYSNFFQFLGMQFADFPVRVNCNILMFLPQNFIAMLDIYKAGWVG